jgi:GT2 family glycosyltransferase
LVVATYNRAHALAALLRALASQTLAPAEFEVVVVDDGSQPEVATSVQALAPPYRLTVLRQANAGPAAARHAGVLAARGATIVIVDDDMRLPGHFLAAHAAQHAPGTRRVVLGLIEPAPELARMPLFERFHAEMLARFRADVRAGRQVVQGAHVCTGNVSFPRADYLALGGFDRTLDRSEDAELGVRFQKAGLEFVFCEQANSVHASDHTRLDVWLGRALRYGLADLRIGDKHKDVPYASPWRFYGLMHPLARPLLLVSLLWPDGAGPLARAGMGLARLVDRLGLERLAIMGTTVVYGMQYHRGLRQGVGSARAAWAALRAYRARAAGTRSS